MSAAALLEAYADHLDAGTDALGRDEDPTTDWLATRRDFDARLRRTDDWHEVVTSPDGIAALSRRRIAAARFEDALRARLAALAQAVADARRSRSGHRAYRARGVSSALYIQQTN